MRRFRAFLLSIVDALVGDGRDALRFWARHPGLALTLLSLALGIGANTAMFSIMNGLALRPLPVAEPARLLFGLAPRDPATIGVAVVILATVATAASWVPARRASRLDPMSVLREEG